MTFTLDAELTGVKKFLMARPVQKSMDAEMANLDKAKACWSLRLEPGANRPAGASRGH